jgi:hypothetical protein
MFLENKIAQRIFYISSAVGETGKPHERTHFYAFRTQTMQAICTKAMTGRGNNDTSVQS